MPRSACAPSPPRRASRPAVPRRPSRFAARRRPSRFAAPWLAVLALLAGGCSAGGASSPADPQAAPVTQGAGATAPAAYAVPRPGPLHGRLYGADLLVTATGTLPDELVARVRAVRGVESVLPLSVASASVDGRTLTVAAAAPGRFRRYTPARTAYAGSVWRRVADGEVAVDTGVSRRLVRDRSALRLGPQSPAPAVPIGAYAPLVRRIDVVVNPRRGAQLGIPERNALLVSTGRFTPSALRNSLAAAVRGQATLQTLALEFDVRATEVAVLTGASVSQAVGTFSYTNRSHGEIAPDPAWVAAYIRTERVPILGEVTCNKGFLPQLRAALEEVERLGLASAIHPGEYAGCYYPRYIGRDPAKGLSLHSWGIAVDLNVPGNQRGTAGEIDRRVVGIFERWGMTWGGRWRYTDPMHFEMSAVVRPAGG